MTQPNLLPIATQAQQMAKNAGADGRIFQQMAMVCMGVMAAASVVQALRPLLRDLDRQEWERQPQYERGRGR